MSKIKVELLDKIQALGFNPTSISRYTDIPDGRIRKWYAGKGLPKVEDFQKLQDLYEKFYKNPTNDFVGLEESTGFGTNNDKMAKKIEELEKLLERLSKSNADLTDLLKKSMEGAPSVHPSVVIQPYLERISLAGVGVCWESFEAGLVKLGKIVLGDSKEKIKLGKKTA